MNTLERIRKLLAPKLKNNNCKGMFVSVAFNVNYDGIPVSYYQNSRSFT